MKKTLTYITLAAATMLTAACTQEDGTTTYLNDPNVVHIKAQIGNGEVSGGFVTRSTPVGTESDETSFSSGDKISVTAEGQGAVVYTLDSDGSTWNPETGKFLKWVTSPMEFTAYYPVTDGTDSETFTVPADQSSLDKIKTADYMTFSNWIARESGDAVTLTMLRNMARLVITPNITGDQYTGTYTVSSIKVYGNTNGYSNSIVASGNLVISPYKHTDDKYYALLSPTTEDSEADFIEVTISNGTDTQTLKAKGIPTTEAGKNYAVTLTIGKNVASIASVTITDWSTGSITSSYAAEMSIPYVTFSAASEATFSMNLANNDLPFVLGENEYFEYSVGGSAWTRFTSTISSVSFGGTHGDLRLRGKSSKGTELVDGSGQNHYSTISFGGGVDVSCTGDIRTLIDYRNYETANTSEARFGLLFSGNTQLKSAPQLPATVLATGCYRKMFRDCSALVTAPELPATNLASGCYHNMFDGCTSLETAPTLSAPALVANCYDEMFKSCANLSNVTMLATSLGNSSDRCVYDWLKDAGTSATTRTLKLANQEVYNTLDNGYYLPGNWKSENATIIYANGQ